MKEKGEEKAKENGKDKEAHLTPEDLAKRWNLPLSTLSQWRWNGRGPDYLKLGKRISYRIEEIKAFERKKLRRDTTCNGNILATEETTKKENDVDSE